MTFADKLELVKHDPRVRDYLRTRNQWAFTFKPRPDDPANFDQQESFIINRDPVSFLVGGNAAGTTTAAAAKCAKFLLQDQPPPRKNTPFWIISNTYEQTCDVCWQEKLVGNGFIPECEYDLNQISYHNVRKGWPSRVPLKPWPTDRGGHPNKNWQLEFKSFEQGREAMQAKSIGGFWFSEQFPLEIFLEVLRGCREYMFPGGQFSEFTPIDPELSVWVEELEENRPEGWAFYRANTRSNKGNLAEGWFEQFFGTVSDEMQGTRMTGELATFEGSIYPSFVREMHVIDESQISPPPGAWHFMGTDWGSSEEHPHTTVFGYRDGVGDWVVYDEYWSIDQRMIMVDHANEIIDMAARWGWPIETVDDASEAARQRATELSRIGRRIAIEQNLMYGNNFADPSRPGEINTFCQCGIPTVSAMNSVYNGIQHVRDLLKVRESTGMPRLFISSRCKHLIAEMRKYRWKQKPKMKKGSSLVPTVVRPEPLKKDDDTVDSMRYMLFSADSGSGDTPSRVQNFTEQKTTRTIQLRREASRSIQVARKDGLLR